VSALSIVMVTVICLWSVPASALPIHVDQTAAYRALFRTGA
jgi:hypothetical protein